MEGGLGISGVSTLRTATHDRRAFRDPRALLWSRSAAPCGPLEQQLQLDQVLDVDRGGGIYTQYRAHPPSSATKPRSRPRTT